MKPTYESPLASRYASKYMLHLFSPDSRFETWRRLWVALAQAQHDLGLPVTQAQVDELAAHVSPIDYDVVSKKEKEIRHDVMAHIYAFGVDYIFEHWGGWPHKSKRSFVVSHYDTNVTPDCGVEFLTEEPLQRVYELKQETDMLVVGGGKLLTSLIKAGLLDSLTIYTVPVMAGKGIGFVGETSGSLWKLSESRVLDNGVVCSTYLFGGNI